MGSMALLSRKKTKAADLARVGEERGAGAE
jgi:hypothetical protein